MRFMILLKGDQHTEAGVMPDTRLLAAMGAYNESLMEAGVLVGGEGLHPTSRGARVIFSGEERTIVEGPFPEVGQLISGFWIFQVASLQDAIAWIKRCPNPLVGQAEIEIRQIFSPEDFGEALTPELREAEARLRERAAAGGPTSPAP